MSRYQMSLPGRSRTCLGRFPAPLAWCHRPYSHGSASIMYRTRRRFRTGSISVERHEEMSGVSYRNAQPTRQGRHNQQDEEHTANKMRNTQPTRRGTHNQQDEELQQFPSSPQRRDDILGGSYWVTSCDTCHIHQFCYVTY